MSEDVLIRETAIVEAQASFDARTFAESKFFRKSEPIGNVLEKRSGELYHDADNLRFRKEVVKNRCPDCRMSCMYFVSLRKEVFPFLWFIVKRFLKGHGRAVKRARKRRAALR